MTQRLSGGSWKTIADFKEAILREWKRVTLVEIRVRISEMPQRCKDVQQREGKRTRSSLR